MNTDVPLILPVMHLQVIAAPLQGSAQHYVPRLWYPCQLHVLRKRQHVGGAGQSEGGLP